ncbi:MAG: flagellar hook-associated protein FlgK [Acidobacteria bacterium]|nr:flagellar hook-associated protein FlgK [Acidobacteriota bacterium]
MSLFSSLRSSAGALQVFERSLDVIQNNVSNASTPGYARQIQDVVSLPFDPAAGLSGGIRPLDLTSTRNQFAEEAVRRQVSQQGLFEQKQAGLSTIESNFDISGQGGIPGALSDLLQSFSAWSISPNDGTARQTVLDNAQNLVDSFHAAALSLSQAGADADSQFRGTIGQINALTAQIAQFNADRSNSRGADPGLDANVNAALQQLSELANIGVTQQEDGSYTVTLAGQTPLVVGDRQYRLSADVSVPANPPPAFPSAAPSERVLDASGADITGLVTGGKLAGVLAVRNVTLANLIGSSSQQGDLNRMAAAFADRVNALLTAGEISGGPPAQAGVPLFTYDAGNPATAATTLSVNPAITPDQLAAIDPGPPEAVNGTCLKLAALAQPQSNADEIDGLSFTGFYGELAARVGREVSDAAQSLAVQNQLVTQAQDFRQQVSGVSLNEQAAELIQYQRAYQAAAKMVTVLNELTQTLLDMVQP